MGEGGDAIEAEHRAGTLDGVQGAERRVDQVGVARRVLEVEQCVFELLEQFRGFLAKISAGSSWSCAEHLAHDGQQLVLLERLGDPARWRRRPWPAASSRDPIRW